MKEKLVSLSNKAALLQKLTFVRLFTFIYSVTEEMLPFDHLKNQPKMTGNSVNTHVKKSA